MYVPAKKVVLHHTATSNAYVDGAAEVRAIYAYHAKTLRWGDIGYHSLIDKDRHDLRGAARPRRAAGRGRRARSSAPTSSPATSTGTTTAAPASRRSAPSTRSHSTYGR
jgi:hypothetical protein